MTTPKIQAIIENFVSELSAALTEASHAAISQALGGASSSVRTTTSSSRAVPTKTKSRSKGGKRSPEELEQLTRSLLSYIKKTPGQRIEQIGAALGASTKELALPAKKLIGEKSVKTKGVKRATTYFAN